MPEGPELLLSSRFINTVCRGRIFTGKVLKSEVSHRNPEISWNEVAYKISSSSRGKELQITLTSEDKDGPSTDEINGKTKKRTKSKRAATNKCMPITENSLKIIFNFGMSGRFNFCAAEEIVKHSHLNFYTNDKPEMVLSFVDYRRFGRWRIDDNWAVDRGPCIMLEYPRFRQNVFERLSESAFNKPICEVLLNQKYFNGVGNYLRAEVLYRAGIRPFDQARSVLEDIQEKPGCGDTMIKNEEGDVLELCHRLALEVVNLGSTVYNPSPDQDYSKFTAWLQCYYNAGMKNMVDHNKRTIWFSGDPGPMVPKEIKTKGMKRSAVKKKIPKEEKPKTEQESAVEPAEEPAEEPKTKVRKTGRRKTSNSSDTPNIAISKDVLTSRPLTRASLKEHEPLQKTSPASTKNSKTGKRGEMTKSPAVDIKIESPELERDADVSLKAKLERTKQSLKQHESKRKERPKPQRTLQRMKKKAGNNFL